MLRSLAQYLRRALGLGGQTWSVWRRSLSHRLLAFRHPGEAAPRAAADRDRLEKALSVAKARCAASARRRLEALTAADCATGIALASTVVMGNKGAFLDVAAAFAGDPRFRPSPEESVDEVLIVLREGSGFVARSDMSVAVESGAWSPTRVGSLPTAASDMQRRPVLSRPCWALPRRFPPRRAAEWRG